MVHFGPWDPFRTLSGPSCCIFVPFIFRSVLTKYQASNEGFFSISSSFGPVSCLFRSIWSILAHLLRLGPCLVHLTEFLFHFCSQMCSQKMKSVQKIKSVKKDFQSVWTHIWSVLDHMVHFGQYGPFGTMCGPSYCISVPFLFRNVPRKNQAKKGFFVHFCSVWAHVWSVLVHMVSLGP